MNSVFLVLVLRRKNEKRWCVDSWSLLELPSRWFCLEYHNSSDEKIYWGISSQQKTRWNPMEPTWNWKVPEGPRKFMKTQEKRISIWCHVQPKYCGTLAEVQWWLVSFFLVFERDSEVNALLKYRKVGRNQMFFYCSSIVSKKEYYWYEIHLFSENSLLHVVILLDTISGCSSDFIHLSMDKCRLLGCVWWAKPPLVRLRIDAQHQLQGAAFVGKKTWVKHEILYLKMEDYIILFFDVEHSFIYPWWTSTPEKSWWLVGWFWRRVYMDVSENSGNYPPNHPILIGFSIKKTIHFGVFPYFWKHPSLEIRSFTSGTSQVYVYIGDSDVNDVDGSLLGSQLFWVKQNQENSTKSSTGWCHLRSMLTITVAPGTSNYFLEALMGSFFRWVSGRVDRDFS